jgi:hypothetical protein
MNVTSKFRQMYLAKLFFFFVAGFLFASICFHFSTMSDGKLNFQYAPCWIGILIIVALIIEIILTLTLRTISVTENGIIFKCLFFNKSKVVEYKKILNIERLKIRQRVRSVPISDGYHLSVLNLIDGKQEIISPDKFENYNDIINAIKSNLKYET